MNEVERKLFEMSGNQAEAYKQEVTHLIRRRYSLSDELALSRQRDEKPEEWEVFYAYCEECKRRAKEDIYGGASAWV